MKPMKIRKKLGHFRNKVSSGVSYLVKAPGLKGFSPERREFIKAGAKAGARVVFFGTLLGLRVAAAAERKVGGLYAKKGAKLDIFGKPTAARQLHGDRTISPGIKSGDFITTDGKNAGTIVTMEKRSYTAGIVAAPDGTACHIKDITRRLTRKPALVFNGAFYDRTDRYKKPSGALVVDGKIIQGYRKGKFDAMVYVDRVGQIQIARRNNFPDLKKIRFGVQTYSFPGIHDSGNYTLIGKHMDGGVSLMTIKKSTPEKAMEILNYIKRKTKKDFKFKEVALLDGGPMSRILERKGNGYISSDLFEGAPQGHSQNFFVIY